MESAIHRFGLWVRFNHGSHLYQFKWFTDLVLATVWCMWAMERSLSVYQKLCFPLWNDALCTQWSTDHSAWPLFSVVIVLGIEAVIFYLLHQRHLRDTIGALRGLSLTMWFHMYFNFLFAVLVCSMYGWWLFPFVLAGIGQDVYMVLEIRRHKDTLRLSM